MRYGRSVLAFASSGGATGPTMLFASINHTRADGSKLVKDDTLEHAVMWRDVSSPVCVFNCVGLRRSMRGTVCTHAELVLYCSTDAVLVIY